MDKLFIDQMGREICLHSFPQRIVSLVPSQTELLYDLGLGERVIGITKFCIHPEIWFSSKTRIGGTKKLDRELISALRPDLIIGNKEENTKEDIDWLESVAPVWMSDISNLEDAIFMIQSIGEITDTSEVAKDIIQRIESSFELLARSAKAKSVLYFIWYDPLFMAGRNTFIHDMLERIGWNNLCTQARYPTYTQQDLQPDFVLLSSEPFPFSEKHIDEVQRIFPNSKVVLVDGELFSWYGSRLLKSPAYFKRLVQQLTN